MTYKKENIISDQILKKQGKKFILFDSYILLFSLSIGSSDKIYDNNFLKK
jgi:hypothetical protein